MSVKTYEQHKSSIGGMDANLAALLVYIISAIVSFIPYLQFVAFVVPIIFLMQEKDSELVKFHARQAFALYLVTSIVSIIMNVIIWASAASFMANPLGAYNALAGLGVLSLIVGIVGLIILIFAIMAMINAYKYKEYAIPFFNDLGNKLAGKIGMK
jgi:Predicted membrane protein